MPYSMKVERSDYPGLTGAATMYADDRYDGLEENVTAFSDTEQQENAIELYRSALEPDNWLQDLALLFQESERTLYNKALERLEQEL